jgi:hypothetical protein
MTLFNNEDGIRITTTTTIQVIGNLLNKIDQLNNDQLEDKVSPDRAQQIINDLQEDLNNLQNSYRMIAHDVDCYCTSLMKEFKENKPN